MEQRHDWADNIHDNWHDHGHDFWNEFQDDFGEPGWRAEYPRMANAYFNYNHPYANGWWTFATAAAVTGWVAGGWGEPVYYDYGSGGNCYYDEGSVYMGDEQYATAEEYADQAQQTAEYGAEQLTQPAAEDSPEAEWMPLGVFALSTSADDKNPTRMMQLAVNKTGLISGTLYNLESKKTLPIQGSVDKKTQRACWFAGDKKDVVAETGIFNLTQDQTPVLIHFGNERTEEYLLVRLPEPDEASAQASAVGN